MSARAIADVRGQVLNTTTNDPLTRLKRSWSAAFVTSATLGVLAGVSGLGINALFLFDIAENKGTLSLAGTWLLVVAFPLLFLSAHSLDRVDTVERMIRAEYCDKHGVKDRDC